MSWLFSQAAAGASSPARCSASTPSARSSIQPQHSGYWCADRMKGSSNPSLSGMTFEPSMESHGKALLGSYLAAFPARHSARQQLDATSLTTFGRRWRESWQMLLPGMCSPRTSAGRPLREQQRTAGLWVTAPAPFPLARETWVLTTFGADIGYLHTPTTKANYAARSMQKWPSARFFVTAFGRPSPTNQEWLMGWPIGWTATQPLGMDRFQSWLQQHSASSRLTDAA